MLIRKKFPRKSILVVSQEKGCFRRGFLAVDRIGNARRFHTPGRFYPDYHQAWDSFSLTFIAAPGKQGRWRAFSGWQQACFMYLAN